jgi:hypothetical protein
MNMARSRVLASGHINGSDMISVELIEPIDAPAVVVVRWPQAPSVADPRRFSSVANSIMHIVASASVRLTAMRAKRL